MKATLKVRNFGPIREVDLDLRNVNVFIGPQASGKSTLAKIYTICKSPFHFFGESVLSQPERNPNHFLSFKKALEDYNIVSFLSDDTIIEFDSELHYFKFENERIFYDGKFQRKIGQLVSHSERNFQEAKRDIIDIITEFHSKLLFFEFFINELFQVKIYDSDEIKTYLNENLNTTEQLQKLIEKLKAIESELSFNAALYIPAERNFISIIKGASLNLINNNVPIPKHVLTFGAEFEKASYEKKELDLSFLKTGLYYKNENGLDYIFHSSKEGLRLTDSASGLQSIVPLLLPILAKRESNRIGHKSFIIEEPELNLFPKAQYELIKVLERDRFDAFSDLQDIGTIHIYTTHSPYILSAFNNILFAGIVYDKIRDRFYFKEKLKWEEASRKANEVYELIPALLRGEYFSAYQVSDGTATSIFNRETGLIIDNFIDDATDEMGDIFDALMELMNKHL